MKQNSPYSVLFFFLAVFSAQAQTVLSGRVSDTLGNPLQGANVLAFPENDAPVTFAVSNAEGKYELALEHKTNYEIKVSYIGYQQAVYKYLYGNKVKNYDFKLQYATEQLSEVVLDFELPVTVKEDTTVFKVDAFTSGNERKLKDQLKKIPGVEVERDGKITFKGKEVTTLLVENKDFFGGNTQLGIENIPADAVDKVEFIDKYTEVGFMKDLSDSDRMAINVKLKEGKKKFLFGDVQAGYDFNNYYLGHAGLFYFSPKYTFSYVGKANNTGEKAFSFNEMLRFQGGISSMLSERKRLNDLRAFTTENTHHKSAEMLLNALNFNVQITPKTLLSGYVLQHQIRQESQVVSHLRYLQNNSEENTNKRQKIKNNLLLANLKLDYKPKRNNQLFYNIYADVSNNLEYSDLVSVQNSDVYNFKNSAEAVNANIRHYIEWYRRHSWKSTTTAVINHTFAKNTPENSWVADRPFLVGFLPLQPDVPYAVWQNQNKQTNDFDAMVKQYWRSQNKLQFNATVGNRLLLSRFSSQENQKISNVNMHSFDNDGFGNELDYLLNTLYAGIEMRFNIGKWSNNFGIFAKNYTLSVKQTEKTSLNKTVLQPIWESSYKFWDGLSIEADYRLDTDFANAEKYAKNYSLAGYQAIMKGNSLLKNERFHKISVQYLNTQFLRGSVDVVRLGFNRKIDAVRQSVTALGVNQKLEFIQMDTPETNWYADISITRRIRFVSLRFSAAARGFEFTQKINADNFFRIRNSQDLGLTIKNVRNKKVEVSAGYKIRFHQLGGSQKDSYQTQLFTAGLECNLIKNIIFQSDYELTDVIRTNTSNRFDFWKASVLYQKEGSPFGFELKGLNLLGSKQVFANSYSDYLISSQYSDILPRMIIFSLHYKI